MKIKKLMIIFVCAVLLYVVLQVAYSGYFMLQGRKLTKTVFTKSMELGDNSKPEFNLFVAGDSVAAGVGASSFETSVGGRLAVYLASNYKVIFRSEAKSGRRMADMLEAPVPSEKQDLILLIISSNDLFHFSKIVNFRENTGKVFEKYSQLANKVVVVGPGRVFDSGAIPLVLRPIYKIQSGKYAKILAKEAGKYDNFVYINPLDPPNGIKGVKNWAANDHFHPGDDGYVFWFEMVKTAL